MASITRSLLNASEGTIDVYWAIPDHLDSQSSVTFFKRGGVDDNIVDWRLRTKGVMDVKLESLTPVVFDLQWVSGQRCRSRLSWLWTEIPDSGGLGLMKVDAWHFARGNGEYEDADSYVHAEGTTHQPANVAHGSPGDHIQFEVEREWVQQVGSLPYGTPPPAPPLNPAITLIRPGAAGNDWAMFAVYTGDALITDTVALKTSIHPDMSGATSHSLGTHDSGGFNVIKVTGLAANTKYYGQATVNGTARGPVAAVRTTQTVGTPCTIKRAVGGCQQLPPASTACFTDMVAWGADRFVHLGDDTYPHSLTADPLTHEATYAASMADDWAQIIAAAGIGMNKVISDHDVNGSPLGQNMPNFNDPTTAASLLAWAAAVSTPMVDTRSPKVGRYWSEVEGNVRFVYLDQRNIQRTDVRKTHIHPDDPASLMIDATQEAWLYTEAHAAADNDQLLIVYTDTAFLGVASYDDSQGGISPSESDKWGAYTVQRDRIDVTLAGIMPHTGAYVNCEIWHSDSHALQYGVSDNGIKVRCCGPLHQGLHAHYQDHYLLTFPENTKGSGNPTGDNTSIRQQYMRQTIVESPAGTWVVTADMRQCSTKVAGTPNTPHTDSTTYTIGAGIPDLVVSDPGNQTNAVGDDVSLSITASGGVPPYSWDATGLPPGLSIDTSDEEVLGAPDLIVTP